MPLKDFTYEAGTTGAPQVRDALMEAGAYLGELMSLAGDKRGQGYDGDVRSAIDRIHKLDPLLTAMERSEKPASPVGPGPVGATLPLQNAYGASAGALVISDAGYQSFAEGRQAGTTHKEIPLDGSLFYNNQSGWRGAGQERATIDSTATGTPKTGGGVWSPIGQPFQTPPIFRQMRLFLRDVLSVQETSLGSIPYIREVNPAGLEFGSSAVAEGAAKPEVNMNWTQDDAPVRKIAAWVPATEEVIDDAPTLRGYIDTRLTYMLAVREEFEILNGDGNAPHLKGILQYSDIQTQTTGADNMIRMGLAQAKIENVDGDPDGIAMNPLDFWTMITTRQANRFDGEGFTNGPPTLPFGDPHNLPVWGLPVVRSRAIVSGQAVVGSWRLGATLFDRMQTVIKVGNQHSDFFVLNKVVILAEERVALAVHRPDFFVKVTLA